MNVSEIIENHFFQHASVLNETLDLNKNRISQAYQEISKSISEGGKLIIFGNGGSAADAQHIAAEFTGRFVKERKSLPALALTTDTSALTAIGNDYGFEYIFQRQLMGLLNEKDIIMGISTSGNSENVYQAIKYASSQNSKSIGLLGRDGGKIAATVNIPIIIPSQVTALIQEMHIVIAHVICTLIDQDFN